MEPKDLITAIYKDLPNPACPVVVEYGWIVEGLTAYELARSQSGDLWGVAVVTLDLETRKPKRDLKARLGTESEAEARAHIEKLKNPVLY